MGNLNEFDRLSLDVRSATSTLHRLSSALEHEINARDRVDISLSEYEGMKDGIEELIKENKKLKKENDIYKDILRRCKLPVDLIADGKVKNIDRFENVDAISRERTYMVKLTVAEEVLL